MNTYNRRFFWHKKKTERINKWMNDKRIVCCTFRCLYYLIIACLPACLSACLFETCHFLGKKKGLLAQLVVIILSSRYIFELEYTVPSVVNQPAWANHNQKQRSKWCVFFLIIRYSLLTYLLPSKVVSEVKWQVQHNTAQQSIMKKILNNESTGRKK